MFGTGLGAMVGLLVVALLVVPVSFGVAARADAKARRLSGPPASDANEGRSVAVAEGSMARGPGLRLRTGGLGRPLVASGSSAVGCLPDLSGLHR